MSGVLHHRIRHSEEALHSAWYGVLLSPLAPSLLFVAILVVCLLLFSRAA
jgi:hypothetical protein